MSTPSRRRAYGVSERILFVANQVEAFNRDREEHREVDVTFRYVDVETFQNQGKAHQNQEESASILPKDGVRQNHQSSARRTSSRLRHHHGCHHNKQVIRQTHSGNHRVEAEDNIQQHNLHDSAEE